MQRVQFLAHDTEIRKQIAGNDKGIAAVLAAMNTHSGNAKVARKGYNALGCLAHDEEITKFMGMTIVAA